MTGDLRMTAVAMRSKRGELPALAASDRPGLGLDDALAERDLLESALHEHGAVLLRGFGDPSPESYLQRFKEFVEALSGPPLDYHERSSPRHAVAEQVFTATDHPSALEIFPHNEQSYNLTFPRRLHFMCLQPAETGGATTIVDSRDVLRRVPDRLRDRFAREGYLYVRTLRQHMGLSWQEVFQTEDSGVAEEYCARNDIELTWLADDEARTAQRRDVIAKHPITGEASWFNHCAFFHVSTLGVENAAMLRELFGDDELPNQTYFGNGDAISEEDAALLRQAYTDGLTGVRWEYGDVLVVDNILVSHGRAPYTGPRNVVVAMTGPTAWDDLRPETA